MPDVEDKLSAMERIRLESLAQAVASSGAMTGRVQTAGDILSRAKTFENYIIDGSLPPRRVQTAGDILSRDGSLPPRPGPR